VSIHEKNNENNKSTKKKKKNNNNNNTKKGFRRRRRRNVGEGEKKRAATDSTSPSQVPRSTSAGGRVGGVIWSTRSTNSEKNYSKTKEEINSDANGAFFQINHSNERSVSHQH